MPAEQIEILPSGPISAQLRPPSSKSITNRALICAALARGESTLRQPLASDDTHVMQNSLQRLGITVETTSAGDLRVSGQAGTIPAAEADLFIGNSGTSVRFLTAMVAVATRGTYTLDGVPRMRERPIEDLLDALRQLGARVESLQGTGCPPVRVSAQGLAGGSVTIRGDVSSQFLSGLLMACPYAQSATELQLDGPLVSRPYVDMTTAVMEKFGVLMQAGPSGFSIPSGQAYVGQDYTIEPDASAASYLWAAAAITGGSATVLDLDFDSLQGDVGFVHLLAQMGCEVNSNSDGITVRGTGTLRGIDCDMGAVSDTAQTMAAVALFADGPTTIRGVAHNRHKETDRIGNLAIELRKFGAEVTEMPDGLQIIPPQTLRPATIETYDDHRMAMSLALPGLRQSGVRILDPGCTAKTYPHYFEDLSQVRVPPA